jgi:signal transduction histidine kinase
MKLSRSKIRQHVWALTSLTTGFLLSQAAVALAEPGQNPIARLARLFDSQLVKVEDRVTWLDGRISTFARRSEYPLKTGIGYRGARVTAHSEDPSVTLDLGTELPVEQIFLIPAQPEFLQDQGIFPKRFTLEVSKHADFAQPAVVYKSGPFEHPPPQGSPVLFTCGETARYVRLTVQEGHMKEAHDLFGLSEFVVISNGEPVSFGAGVATVGSLRVEELWHPEALVDGRTPLGIWHNATQPNQNPGDAVMDDSDHEITTWSLDLDAMTPLDRVILFPYQISRSFETSVFPESLEIRLDQGDGSPAQTVFEWTNPLPGSSHMAPMVIPLKGKSARSIRVIARRPWIMGDRKLHALSEIEVWSGGSNLARDRSIRREHAGQSATITSLTDGYSSDRQIIKVGTWLYQLRERSRLEHELASLRGLHRQLSSNSELNATWGSAVILGLTFLIPVFIVERRRLMSKDQLEQIRKRIASDLHDDIGSNLGSISLIARTARKDLVRLQGPEEIAEDLDEVETIARESSLAMRDIVWLLERRQDSIGDLVQRMRDTAGRLLREMDYKVECESSKTAAKLSLDAKRHLFLFYKEAIHNVLKHSRANKVLVRLWDEDDKLALEIIDNGIGLPAHEPDRPAGVNKLQDRARVLDGVLQVTSSKGNGTHIRLFVKRSHLTHQPALS